MQSALRGQLVVGGLFGSPSKQNVPAASMSRQKPQNTLCWVVQAPVPTPVQQPKGVMFPVHWLFGPARFSPVTVFVPVVRDAGPDSIAIASRSGGGGQSWLVG